MTRHSPRTSRRRAAGFSLTELIVAIGIIFLLLGLTFPVVNVLQNSGRIEAGLNTAGMAADVARQWVKSSAWNEDPTNGVSGESYTGTAALFCPTNEIRIVVNLSTAQDTSNNFLEEFTPALDGYSDKLGLDYIRVPDGVGIAGIVRTGSGANDVRYIAPPFAVAFNASGQLHYGDTSGLIYYDANADSDFDTAATRANVTGGYDPADWTGRGTATNAGTLNNNLVLNLPFEAVECVVGVIVFDNNQYEDSGLDFAGGGYVDQGTTEGDWLLENGEPLFFSPHTGIGLRDENE